ncbi:MAG: transposase [Rhodothermales bacterium]
MHLPQRRTTRLSGFDYGSVGYYFVTVCVAERKKSLAHMRRAQVVLSSIGTAAETELRWLPVRFDFVQLDAYQVMPDHLHAIIGLARSSHVEVSHREFSRPQARSLSMVVNHLKGTVTRYARRYVDPTFSWQGRFYERVIRNDTEMASVRQYIVRNPERLYLEQRRGGNHD